MVVLPLLCRIDVGTLCNRKPQSEKETCGEKGSGKGKGVRRPYWNVPKERRKTGFLIPTEGGTCFCCCYGSAALSCASGHSRVISGYHCVLKAITAAAAVHCSRPRPAVRRRLYGIGKELEGRLWAGRSWKAAGHFFRHHFLISPKAIGVHHGATTVDVMSVCWTHCISLF